MDTYRKFRKLPTIVIISMIVLSMVYKFSTNGWNKRVLESDVLSYYSYLTSTVIYNDITLSFLDDGEENYSKYFWAKKNNNGKYIIKTTMGMAIIYSPFFFIAHGIEKISGQEANGYSATYKTIISFGALFYLIIGLIIIKKLLQKIFSPLITTITLVLLYFGTNLYYYATIEPGIPHTYDFTLIALFIYLTSKWLNSFKFKHSILLGLLIGIIVLVRPINILIVIILLFWGVKKRADFIARIHNFLKNWPAILIIIICALIVWIPQLLYWKMQSGQYFYNSYNEFFFFKNFHFHEALFGFRKGWFIYTPIMFIATIGLFFGMKKLQKQKLSLYIFLPIFVYFTFSWWCWWYGGGFGARTMIDVYAFMAFPLAGLTDRFLIKKKILKISFLSIILLLVLLNLFQSYQYKSLAIHWDSMTKEAYLYSFFKSEPPDNFEDFLSEPDYERAIQGIPEYYVSPKKTLSPQKSDLYYSKDYIYSINNEYYNLLNVVFTDSTPNSLCQVYIEPNTKYPFANELLLYFTLYDNDTLLWSYSINLNKGSKKSTKYIMEEFGIPFQNFHKKHLTLKVFFNSIGREKFYCKKVEVLIKGIKNHTISNTY